MKNIFYFRQINSIGGIESFFYYLAKKYAKNDITIYYMTGDDSQIARLMQYVRVKRYKANEKIKCEKAFFCFNLDIIDNVEANEYIQIIHGDYKAHGIRPNTHPKITKYLGVSKIACETFTELTLFPCELAYNPIVIEKPKKVLNLISATRLTSEKGKNRMIKLAEMFDKEQIPYIWTIYTDDTFAIKNPNIVYMKPRLNIIDMIANADYLVQLSDTEGYCYSIVEALSVGTPVICTDMPVIKEIGVINGVNAYVCDFDMQNVPIKDIYAGLAKFEYKPIRDKWNQILAKGASTWEKEKNTKVPVKPIREYFDMQLNKIIKTTDEPYYVDKLRADHLAELNLVQIIEGF